MPIQFMYYCTNIPAYLKKYSFITWIYTQCVCACMLELAPNANYLDLPFAYQVVQNFESKGVPLMRTLAQYYGTEHLLRFANRLDGMQGKGERWKLSGVSFKSELYELYKGLDARKYMDFKTDSVVEAWYREHVVISMCVCIYSHGAEYNICKDHHSDVCVLRVSESGAESYGQRRAHDITLSRQQSLYTFT